MKLRTLRVQRTPRVGSRCALGLASASLLALSACSGEDTSPVPVLPGPSPVVAPVPGDPVPFPGQAATPGTGAPTMVDPVTGQPVPTPAVPAPPSPVGVPAQPAPGAVTPQTPAPTPPEGQPGVVPPAPVPAAPVGPPVSGNQTKLRLLSSSEYNGSLEVLFGPGVSASGLPADRSLGGFVSVGGASFFASSLVTEAYEAVALSFTQEFFADEARWRTHVGCDPAPALDGACTADYVRRFGRLAFRHALTPDEVKVWTDLAAALVVESDGVGEALQITTASMLQSPFFLYRVESAVGDGVSPRFAYDAYSTATRLAFLLTGATPTDELLTLAEQGSLNTAQGVRAAAQPLLLDPANKRHLASFFMESAGMGRVTTADKMESLPLTDTLRELMLTEARLWLENVVLAENGDVMSILDSSVTYLNDELGAFYGFNVSGGDFQAVTLPPEAGRAGVFGKGAFLVSHSAADISNPTRRGVFVAENLLCQELPQVPPNIDAELKEKTDAPQTTRQRFEEHQENALCKGCHALMDNYGFAMENFDAIGRVRAEEEGLPVTAATEILGQPVNGAVDMARVLRGSPLSTSCLVQRFYRFANAEADHHTDDALLAAVSQNYQSRVFGWSDFMLDFVSSDAFLSAPVDSRTAAGEGAGEPE